MMYSFFYGLSAIQFERDQDNKNERLLMVENYEE